MGELVFLMTLMSSLLFFALAVSAAATNSTEFPMDPYLQYRPPFARSLPVQILLTGIVLTLVAVLFIHLVFTAQYHWPLAPVNYVLQISGVTTLLISLIATIHVVLSASFDESERWPYMLSYIAVNVPPLDLALNTSDWSVAERATWLVMNASTSGLIQITHIQFLTLLYPSRLEGRLIFTLLGPLAVVAAIMQLIPIHGSPTVISASSAIRNVCNATLSILFTAALFLWGLLVNRSQAWRTDGGTAAFGCAALSLAMVSSALNFLYVHREDEFVWLPGLMWAVVLWQSFLGWWWWVGAGSGSALGLMGGDDIEDKLRREAKKESRRREARERRIETRKKAKQVWREVTGLVTASSTARDTESTSLVLNTNSNANSSSRPRRRRRRLSTPSPSPSVTATATGTGTSTSFTTYSFTSFPRALPRLVHKWYASLRRAHITAARAQAEERVERIREMERVRERGEGGGGGGNPVIHRAGDGDGERVGRAVGLDMGWGLGRSFWRARGAERERERERERAAWAWEMKMRTTTAKASEDAEDRDSVVVVPVDSPADIPLPPSPPTSAHLPQRVSKYPQIRVVSSSTIHSQSERQPHSHPPPESRRYAEPELRRYAEPEHRPYTEPEHRRYTEPEHRRYTEPEHKRYAEPEQPRSVWWWGPLARWRLKDSTVY